MTRQAWTPPVTESGDLTAYPSDEAFRALQSRERKRRVITGLAFVLPAVLFLALSGVVWGGIQAEKRARATEMAAWTASPGATVTASPLIEILAPGLPAAVVADGKQAVELVFQVVSDSEPAPDGIVVQFRADGGQVEPALAVTQDGVAQTWFTPERWSGRDQALVVVQVGNLEEAFPLRLEEPPGPGSLRWEGVPASVKVGEQAVITVVALDAGGQPLPDVALTFRAEPEGMGWIMPAQATTDDTGRCQVTYAASAVPGPATLVAEAQDGSGISQSAELRVVADQGGLFVFPNRTTLLATGSDQVTLTVRVFDASGAPLVGELVTWTIESGEAWFLGDDQQPLTTTHIVTRSTDEGGQVVVLCRAGTMPGEVLILARAVGQERLVVLVVEAPRPMTIIFETNKEKLPADGKQKATLSITVTDQLGNPMPGVTVTLALSPTEMGSLAQGAESLKTGDDGKATASFVVGKKVGTVTITATVGELSARITLTLTRATASPTPTPSPTPTYTPTLTPTDTSPPPQPTPIPPSPTNRPEPTTPLPPSPTHTPEPTLTPTPPPTVTPKPTYTPLPSPTPIPTPVIPTRTPTPTPSDSVMPGPFWVMGRNGPAGHSAHGGATWFARSYA